LIATPSDITALIASQSAMVEILRAVEALRLPDCWIGAGFVRNPIWDALHGFPWSASYTNADVVYCDSADLDPELDRQIETRLAGCFLPYLGRSRIRRGCTSRTAIRLT